MTTRTSTIQQQSQNNQSLYNKRFHELEEQIKQHQHEFQSIHARFDTLNDQILRSMTIASDHSRQFSHLENQMSDMHAALQILIARGDSQPQINNPTTRADGRMETRITPRNLAREIHDGHHDMTGFGYMSIASNSSDSQQSTESAPILSPEKRRSDKQIKTTPQTCRVKALNTMKIALLPTQKHKVHCECIQHPPGSTALRGNISKNHHESPNQQRQTPPNNQNNHKSPQ